MSKEKRSNWYALWRWFLCRCLDLFYRKMEASGQENIPNDKPIIFASNHTNALIDPLVITYFSGKQHYFMTRGDVFSVKLIEKLFRSWRMLPLFRMKDGIETLSRNNAEMTFVTKQLAQGQSMIIFPEGSHFWKRQVHPLKKGLVRMAFDVVDKNPASELVVIPVGLYYNDMIKLNQDVLVNFGEPISLSDFSKEENIQKTFLRFNEHLRSKMQEQIIHIDLEGEAYEQAEAWRVELAVRLRSLPLKETYAQQKSFIRIISSTAFQEENAERSLSLDEVLKTNEVISWWQTVEPKLYQASWSHSLVKAIKFPFYLLSFLQFFPLFYLGRMLLGKIKDRTFHNSVKFGLALLVQPFFTLLFGLLMVPIFGSWWAFPIYLLSAPLWAVLFTEWRGNQKVEF